VTGFRQNLGLAAVGASALIATPASAGEIYPADTVVELFTSQGCSSCPPADALAGQLASHKNIVVLSMPVDYWDYLGWKDTFAKHQFSERQRNYSVARGDGQVYTPQVIVNGLQHAVGSEEDSIQSAIAATSAELNGKRVPLNISMQGDGVSVEVGAAPTGVGAGTVLLADFKSSADVTIKRGENGGHTVTYFHVVRELKPIGEWTGRPMSIHLSTADLAVGGSDGCAVLLQQGNSGAILAAAQVESW
jgi:hypothetical protein